MDIKAKIEEIVNKVTKDETVKAQFQKDPVKAVEQLLGVEVPQETMDKIVAGVKAKLTGDKLAGAADSLKKFLK
jgi:hypothetical protein